MHISLENKVVIVTGASRGIGLATVISFVEAGATVIASTRNASEHLSELSKRAPVLPVIANAATDKGAQQLVERAAATYGKVDVLVNNIGAEGSSKGSSFLEITDEQWSEMMDVNFMSVVRATRAALPALVEQKGTIVNISSMLTTVPSTALIAYSAAKAAVTNVTKSLAEQYGPQGIRINSVAPGPTRTAMWEGAGHDLNEIAQQIGVTLDRFAEPNEIANLVVFLASEHAR